MTTRELVGPVGTVDFRGGPHAPHQYVTGSVNYDVPADTLDPRYLLCVDHHVACDCREAEMAEDRSEWRYEREAQAQAFATILAGHPTWDWDAEGNGAGCMCTGCQLARALHIYPKDSA